VLYPKEILGAYSISKPLLFLVAGGNVFRDKALFLKGLLGTL